MVNPNSPTLTVGGQTLLDMTAAPYSNKFKIVEIRPDSLVAKVSARARVGQAPAGVQEGDIAVDATYSTVAANAVEGQDSWYGDFEVVSLAEGIVRCVIVPVGF